MGLKPAFVTAGQNVQMYVNAMLKKNDLTDI
jgi:hypothetical protein